MMTCRQFAAAGAAALLWPAGRITAAGADERAALSSRAAAGLLISRRLTPVLLVEACLERIRRIDPLINSFITLTTEEALARAFQARTGWHLVDADV
jgi:Asp-tRNA(Asn)/Glu-tRNA(Gln) amidotransferase A subunit family amidase